MPLFRALPLPGRVEDDGVKKCRADALQNTLIVSVAPKAQACIVVAVRCQQQPAFGGSLGG